MDESHVQEVIKISEELLYWYIQSSLRSLVCFPLIHLSYLQIKTACVISTQRDANSVTPLIFTLTSLYISSHLQPPLQLPILISLAKKQRPRSSQIKTARAEAI